MEMERRREGYVEKYMPNRTRGEQLRGGDGPANLKKTKGQGHEHFCYTGMPARNGNFGTDRKTTTKASSVRNNWVRKIARVKRATGEERLS